MIRGAEELRRLAGEHLGYSEYTTLTQELVERFCRATGVPQSAPDGSAPGVVPEFLTLSLGPKLYAEVVRVDGFSMGVNYGANRVRFISPVEIGSKMRLGVSLLEVDDIPGGVQISMEFTFECQDAQGPACVAEIVSRRYF